MKVSVLILTFNEAANLPACLDALAWCDDIWVLDSGSTDQTVEIARARGGRVMIRPFDTFADQRNFGLDHGDFRHEWVLHLDADEVVTDAFVDALQQLKPSDGIDAWRVPSRTILFGRWLRHAGMWPTYQVRLGHVRRLRFIQVGHGQREASPPGRIATFSEAYDHFSFSHGMKRWLEKHVRYARDEADALVAGRVGAAKRPGALLNRDATSRRRAAKALAAALPLTLRPPARFVYIYVFRLGFLDGRPGLAYAMMMSVYEGMIAIFACERALSLPPTDVR